MRSKDVIYLQSMTVTKDAIGNQIETPTNRKIYANKMTVGTSEFYDASAQGLKPTKQFEIYSFEYEGESSLKHEGQTYDVIRTQEKGEKIRLTCEKVIGNG